MPDLKSIGDLISQVGFPIFIACVFVYQVFAMDKANRATLDKQNELLTHIYESVNQLLARK
jgi:hypothetical protein